MKTFRSIRLAPHRTAVADVSNMGQFWEINRINVPSGFRGNGYGSELLRQVCEEADYENATLRLSINPYGDLSYADLQDWYERYGFVQIDEDGTFERLPE